MSAYGYTAKAAASLVNDDITMTGPAQTTQPTYTKLYYVAKRDETSRRTCILFSDGGSVTGSWDGHAGRWLVHPSKNTWTIQSWAPFDQSPEMYDTQGGGAPPTEGTLKDLKAFRACAHLQDKRRDKRVKFEGCEVCPFDTYLRTKEAHGKPADPAKIDSMVMKATEGTRSIVPTEAEKWWLAAIANGSYCSG